MDLQNYIVYVGKFTKTAQGAYMVEFPDLAGCLTQGDSLQEAFCMAQDALAVYYKEQKGNIPLPTDLEILQMNEPNELFMMVGVDIRSYPVKSFQLVNKTLTLPEWLDKLAKKYRVNFSKVLREALIQHLRQDMSVSESDRKLLL